MSICATTGAPQRGLAHQAAGDADGVGGDAAVGLGVQVVGRDDRGGGGSDERRRITPREVGRRLQAATVTARRIILLC